MIIWPIFVFLDDTTLDVCESLEDARRDYEGVDVEAGIYEFYDFKGDRLEAVFSQPNEYSSTLGGIRVSVSGVFSFQRSNDVTLSTITNSLGSITGLNPSSRFSDLSEVIQHIESTIASDEE